METIDTTPIYPKPSDGGIRSAMKHVCDIAEYIAPDQNALATFLVRAIIHRGPSVAEAMWSLHILSGMGALTPVDILSTRTIDIPVSESNPPAGLEFSHGRLHVDNKVNDTWGLLRFSFNHNRLTELKALIAKPHLESLPSVLKIPGKKRADDGTPAERMTVSDLIGQVRTNESDEDRGRRHRAISNAKTPMKGSPEEAAFYAALRWEESAREGRNRVHQEPGADRVLAVCRDEFGDAKADTLMRLRDRLSIRLDCEPAAVLAMSLQDFLDAWKDSTLDGQAQHRTTVKPTAKPEYSANTLKLFPCGVPDNQDLVDLVVLLNTLKDAGKSMNEIARNFVGGDDKKAGSLLSQIRRLKREGKVNF